MNMTMRDADDDDNYDSHDAKGNHNMTTILSMTPNCYDNAEADDDDGDDDGNCDADGDVDTGNDD